MKRLLPTALAGSLSFLAAAEQAFAQGCAMCLSGVLSQGIKGIETMNLGILVLLIPSLLMILSVLAFAFLRRP